MLERVLNYEVNFVGDTISHESVSIKAEMAHSVISDSLKADLVFILSDMAEESALVETPAQESALFKKQVYFFF